LKDPLADDSYRYVPSAEPSAPLQGVPLSQLVLPYVRGIMGVAVGGVMGYVLTYWLTMHGLLATMLPGLAVGMGCGWLSGTRSHVLGALAGAASLAISVVVTWQVFPFRDDESFLFFVLHLHKVHTWMVVMIVFSGACGYWFGLGRRFSYRPIHDPRGKQGAPKP